MNKKLLLVIIVTLLLTVGAVGVVMSHDQTWRPPNQQWPPPNTNPDDLPDRFDPDDRDQYLGIKAAFTMINMTLSAFLIFLYVKVYRDTKSEFTMGLIIVMLALFIYALMANPLIPILFGYRIIGLGMFSVLPDIFATIALSVLLYLGLK